MVDFNTNVFDARLEANIDERSVTDLITTEAVERTGYSARFAPVIAGEVKDYSGTVDWDKATVSPIDLTLNKKAYFAFSVDDIERLKTSPEEIDKATTKQARNIVAKVDEYTLSQIATDAKHKIATAAAKRKITKASDAYELLVDMNKELSKAKAPNAERFAVINHDVLGLLEKDTRFTNNYEILENGLVQGANVNGMQIIASEELPKDKLVAVQKEATGAEKFIDETEALRLQSAFAYGIRGLCVHDAKVIEKDYAVVANFEIDLA